MLVSYISYAFAIFLGVAVVAYRYIPSRGRALFLLLVSYAFYFSWGPKRALLLLAVTGFVYVAALVIERSECGPWKPRLMWGVVTVLLLLLAAFKLGTTVSEILSEAGRGGHELAALLLIVPLGLSYYLFRLLGYFLDVYWENIVAQRNFVSLALYVSFFPQIVSGPIQRAKDFFSQAATLELPTVQQSRVALQRILEGLLKKMAFAPWFAGVVASVNNNMADRSPAELLVGAYAYPIQLYLDFSGLTDIALGIGLLFGLRGPENFRHPFFAQDLTKYWARWHISLTSWLGDYVFLPLRMALRRWNEFGLGLAIFVMMVAVGVWHGFRPTFAVFGALSGIMLAATAITLKRRDAFFKQYPGLKPIRAILGPVIVFHLVAFNLIFFRAATLPEAVNYVRGLVRIGNGLGPCRWDQIGFGWQLGVVFSLTVVCETISWKREQPAWGAGLETLPRPARWGWYYASFLLLFLFGREGTTDFIYAKF